MPPMRETSWLDNVYGWLDVNAPRAYGVHSDNFLAREEPKEGMLIFLEDVTLVPRMVEELQLKLLHGPQSEFL